MPNVRRLNLSPFHRPFVVEGANAEVGKAAWSDNRANLATHLRRATTDSVELVCAAAVARICDWRGPKHPPDDVCVAVCELGESTGLDSMLRQEALAAVVHYRLRKRAPIEGVPDQRIEALIPAAVTSVSLAFRLARFHAANGDMKTALRWLESCLPAGRGMVFPDDSEFAALQNFSIFKELSLRFVV